MEQLFTNIYETNSWGTVDHPDYSGGSGAGSAIHYNKDTFIPFLKKFIINNNIKKIVDLGCGDFRCGHLLYDDLDDYYDAYKKLTNSLSKNYSLPKYKFIHLDFYGKKEEIISGDMCILKDVLIHWPLDDIYTFLDYLVDSKKFKYIMSHCGAQTKDNTNIQTGQHALSCDFFPLKKYNIKKLYNFEAVSIIPKI